MLSRYDFTGLSDAIEPSASGVERTTCWFRLEGSRRRWYWVSVLLRLYSTQLCRVLRYAAQDTGSADLWVISDACVGNCSASVPLYHQSTFQPAGQQVQLLYGDSRTGTHATGPIGKDTAGIAGLATSGQYLAAIVDTNTTVLETGSAGILGVGFPPIRWAWHVFAVRCACS